MSNFKTFVSSIASKVFKLSGEKINQTERNAFKASALESISTDLSASGIVLHRTTEGLVLEIPNDELGVIYMGLDLKVKDTSFDIDEATADYVAKQEAAKARVEAAAKRKAQRLAAKSK